MASPHADERAHHRRRFSGRDPDEGHRAATPLELLYDLTIVVAFGTAADELAHYIAEDHVWPGIGGFLSQRAAGPDPGFADLEAIYAADVVRAGAKKSTSSWLTRSASSWWTQCEASGRRSTRSRLGTSSWWGSASVGPR